MKIGIMTMNTDYGVSAIAIARRAEELGIESIFLPDHSHVPVTRKAPYDGPKGEFKDSPGDMPKEYYHNNDQLITLAAISSVTTTLKLGTGICLAMQRDPIWLAKEIATLDHLSGGRVIFGVGAGAPWNAEEMQNHGVSPDDRFKILGERIRAMQAIWTQDKAEFHGTFVDFDPIFSWPKPVQKPHPPILIGGWAPSSLNRVLAYGDGWFPGAAVPMDQLEGMLAELRSRAAQAGRPEPQVTMNFAKTEQMERYIELGIGRCVYAIPTGTEAETWAALDGVAEVVKRFGD